MKPLPSLNITNEEKIDRIVDKMVVEIKKGKEFVVKTKINRGKVTIKFEKEELEDEQESHIRQESENREIEQDMEEVYFSNFFDKYNQNYAENSCNQVFTHTIKDQSESNFLDPKMKKQLQLSLPIEPKQSIQFKELKYTKQPKQAKNIIKNIINGFKKFCRSINGLILSKLAKQTPISPGQISLLKVINKDWGPHSTAAKVQTQFLNIFNQPLIIETLPSQFQSQNQSQNKSQNQTQNQNQNPNPNSNPIPRPSKTTGFNRQLLMLLISQPQLCNVFQFWLLYVAHYYFTYESKIRHQSIMQHRSAVDTVANYLDLRKKNINSKKKEGLPPFKHVGSLNLPVPKWSEYLKRPEKRGRVIEEEEDLEREEKSRRELKMKSEEEEIMLEQDEHMSILRLTRFDH